jgi:hypothetical protein
MAKKSDMLLYGTGAALALFLLVLYFPMRSVGAGAEGFMAQLLRPSSLVGPEPVSGPSPADLNDRIPYHLLQDVLKNFPKDNQDNSCLNSCRCYTIDFENRIQKTGNFRQLTNNYKRANPDSCSAPFHELVNNFYAVERLKV